MSYISELRMGVGTEEGVAIGPLIMEKAAQDIRELIDDADSSCWLQSEG